MLSGVCPSSKIKRAMRPSSRRQPSDFALQALDLQFHNAGLVRTRRRRRAFLESPVRFARAEPEDLVTPATTTRRAANGVEWLSIPGWDFPWLWAGFSTRKGGSSRAYCAEDAPGELNLGFTSEDERKTVAANRALLAEAVAGDSSIPLVALRQFHSNLVLRATRADVAREHPRKADGQMTDEAGILLAVQTADCVPVLVADPKRHAVAGFHAGWRGTVKRIVESGVGCMRLAFGSRPEDLVAAIGPANGVCCYTVGEEVFSAFESQFDYARELFREVDDADEVRRKYPMLFLTQRAPGHSSIGPKLHVDLIEANRRQLLAAGLKPASIQVIRGCTQCHPKLFFSHRGSRGHTGRMMAVIGIRNRQKRGASL